MLRDRVLLEPVELFQEKLSSTVGPQELAGVIWPTARDQSPVDSLEDHGSGKSVKQGFILDVSSTRSVTLL